MSIKTEFYRDISNLKFELIAQNNSMMEDFTYCNDVIAKKEVLLRMKLNDEIIDYIEKLEELDR